MSRLTLLKVGQLRPAGQLYLHNSGFAYTERYHVFSMSGAAGLFREAAGTEVVGLL